ncbi:Eaf3p [Ascoidea rubescens DSM 1968]|uniref:Chromatin modification-related protein EAF3 n=1 Tax=Ascoidea rubescens DSM 1968 TaxID=1344418 RepID=A0A1D2VIX5_9ASCO|nr:MRG-domain-containing protein [Ascoidea rubescens DSM 1968]ODV61437.1 MRG-domain-containing protein [Ascoidea rubescens DSM 1968]
MDEMLGPNSKCLAYHGPLLYEAKILKAHEKDASYVMQKDGQQSLEAAGFPEDLKDQRAYLIHYKGWKASWDEWVKESRVLTFNYENLKLQKELKQAALNVTDSINVSASTKKISDDSRSSNNVSSRRRRTEHEQEKEKEFLSKTEVNINIPDNLKSFLVDDWENITKNHYLVDVPKNPSIMQILKNYEEVTLPSKNNQTIEIDILREVLSGINLYFDRSLGSILLYRFERTQFAELSKDEKNKDKRLCEIYGVEHLLRLFVSLPALIAQTNMDQQSVGVLKENLEDILLYISKNEKTLLSRKNYINVSPAYDYLSKST